MNSETEILVRPKDLQTQYKISQSTYYQRLKVLGITPLKDSQRRAYLTHEQVSLFDALDSHIKHRGTMQGFNPDATPIPDLSPRDNPLIDSPQASAPITDTIPVPILPKKRERPINKKSTTGGFIGISRELEQIRTAVLSGDSALVLGEYGTAKEDLAYKIVESLQDNFNCAVASYTGSVKQFLIQVAESLNIPTTNENDKALNTDDLKEEIMINVNHKTLLLIPEAQRLPASIRYWLDILLNQGIQLVAFSFVNPKKDIFLRLHEIELGLPTDLEIRQIMEDEAKQRGLKLTRSQFAEFQTKVGKNPFLARKVIASHALGIETNKPEHTQYVDISKLVFAALFGLGVFRFVGMGIGDRALYILGGIVVILIVMLKQVLQIRGAKKKLGE